MKTGMTINTDGGSWAFTKEEALSVMESVRDSMTEGEGETSSAEFYVRLYEIKEIISSIRED